MRDSKTITCLALVLLLLQTAGCMTWQPSSPHSATDDAPGWEVGDRYRLTLVNGSEVELSFLSADSLNVFGYTEDGRGSISIPRAEIVSVEDQVVSVRKTVLVSAIILIPVAFIVWAELYMASGS